MDCKSNFQHIRPALCEKPFNYKATGIKLDDGFYTIVISNYRESQDPNDFSIMFNEKRVIYLFRKKNNLLVSS